MHETTLHVLGDVAKRRQERDKATAGAAERAAREEAAVAEAQPRRDATPRNAKGQ